MSNVKLIGRVLSVLSDDTRIKIARYVQKNKKVRFKELRTKLNLNSNTLRFHLRKLQDAKIIVQPKKRGAYLMGKLGNITLTFYDELKVKITR